MNQSGECPRRINSIDRLPVLDGVRGLAILLVMFAHFTVIVPHNDAQEVLVTIAGAGIHGVDLFFVLSGFLITGILIDSKGEKHYFRNFFMRRTLRIFPLYYALIFVSFVVIPHLVSLIPRLQAKVARFNEVSDGILWYLAYASNVLVARNEKWVHGALDITWSLAIEEQFYIIWAPLVYFASVKRLRMLCITLIVLAPVIRIGMHLSGMHYLAMYVLTPCRMDTLAAGSLLAIATREPQIAVTQYHRWARWALGVSGGVLAVTMGRGWWYEDSPIMYTIGYSVISIFCTALVAVLIWGRKSLWVRLFSSKGMTAFGTYSYFIYLSHVPLRAVIRDVAFGEEMFRRLGAIPAQIVFYIITTAVVIPLALLSWHLFEKRFLALKERFRERTQENARAASAGVSAPSTA